MWCNLSQVTFGLTLNAPLGVGKIWQGTQFQFTVTGFDPNTGILSGSFGTGSDLLPSTEFSGVEYADGSIVFDVGFSGGKLFWHFDAVVFPLTGQGCAMAGHAYTWTTAAVLSPWRQLSPPQPRTFSAISSTPPR